jgi:hypothetical protein
MFGKMEFLSTPLENQKGETADRKSSVSDRNRGMQFKVNPPRGGVNNDAMFDKFKTLSAPLDTDKGRVSKYEDAHLADKKAREESRKAMITTSGFRYSSPGKKATGTGSSYGLFNATKFDEPPKAGKSSEPKKKDPEPRNILTSPGKKGTYGVPGTTFGKEETKEPEKLPKEAKKQKDKPEPKNVGPPFKAACKHVEFFDGYPNVPASKIYTIDTKLPAARKPEPPKKPLIAAPFKPSSPGKRGLQGTLQKFPGDDPNDKKIPKESKPKKKDEEKKPSVVWKPTATGHSLPVKSIAYNTTAINSSVIRHG